MPASRIARIEVVRPELVREVVERNNERARALGMGAMTVTLGSPVVGDRIPRSQVPAYYGVKVTPVLVTLPEIGLPPGWELLTRLTAAPGIDPSQPGHDMHPSIWADHDEAFAMGWQRACQCFHCRQPSARTFAMKQTSADGSSASFHLAQECLPRVVERVGGFCPANIIDRLNCVVEAGREINKVRELDRRQRQDPDLPPIFDVRYALALSHSMVRQHGYVSTAQEAASAKTDHPVRATRRRVLPLLVKSGDHRTIRPSAEDLAQADADLSWIRTDLSKRQDLTEYFRRLVDCTAAGFASERDLGTIVSAPVARLRDREFRVQRTPPARLPGGTEDSGRGIVATLQPPVVEAAKPSRSAPQSPSSALSP